MLWLLLLSSAAALGEPAPSGGLDLDLPEMGSSAQAVLTPEQEQELGKEFMRNLRREIHIIDDPLIEEYIQTVGMRLASHGDQPEQQYTFFVVDDPTINAFAGPGGYIGVNSGLILTTGSESDLAAVVAHEIAHVTQGHIARSVEVSGPLNIATLAAVLAAAVIATQDAAAGQAALVGALAGSTQSQINFIRRNEMEADRVGIRVLARTGFDPRAMPGFFDKLQQASRYNVSAAPEFLRTHPVTASRIADGLNRASQYPYKQVADSPEFQVIRARLRLRTFQEPQRAVSYFREGLESGKYLSREATQYGYVLALTAAGDYTEARAQLGPLLQEQPENTAFRLAEADLETESGNPAAGLAVLERQLQLHPHSYLLTYYDAEQLLAQGRPGQARNLLRDYLLHRPPRPGLYRLLAHAERASGNSAGSHEALAEYLYLQGDIEGATAQLERAKRLPDLDFYEKSRIDARLEEFEQLTESDDDDGKKKKEKTKEK